MGHKAQKTGSSTDRVPKNSLSFGENSGKRPFFAKSIYGVENVGVMPYTTNSKSNPSPPDMGKPPSFGGFFSQIAYDKGGYQNPKTRKQIRQINTTIRLYLIIIGKNILLLTPSVEE